MSDGPTQHRRNGESRGHGCYIPYEEKSIRNRRKRPPNSFAILDRILLILDEPTGGVHKKDNRQFLNWMRNLTGQVDMIGQVRRDVSKGVDEVHPPEGKPREEGNGALDDS